MKLLSLGLLTIISTSPLLGLGLLNETTSSIQSEVLFLSSYDKNWSTVKDQFLGIKDSLGTIKISEEYMDTKAHPLELTDEYWNDGICYSSYKKFLETTYTEKFPSKKYDVVIVGDDNALSFLRENEFHDKLFPDTPIVFEGINDIALANEAIQEQHKLFCGVIERTDYTKNIALASALMPEAKKMNIFFDDSLSGKAEKKQFYAAATAANDIPIIDYDTSKMTSLELKESIASLSKTDINFFLTFGRDKERIYDSDGQINIFKENLTAPMFRSWTDGLGDPFVGGYMYSHFYAGQVAGNIAASLIEGTAKIETVGLLTTANGEYVVDHPTMLKFGLDEGKLPVNTKVLNRTVSFFETNKDAIITAIIIVAVALVLIGLISFAAHRFFQQAKELSISNQRLKESGSRLKAMATIDTLTGLKNHVSFINNIDAKIASGSPFFLLMFDINNFKAINDIFGHKLGDEAIKEVAKLIGSRSGKEEIAYRYAGNQFAIMIDGIDNSIVTERAKSLEELDIQLYKDENNNIRLTMSVGIVAFPKDGRNAEELIANCDAAIYYIRSSTRYGHAFYDEKIMGGVKKNSHIADSLDKAIANNDVYMVYHPIYSIKKDRFVGAESLMRINNFPYGPADFIPVAESMGTIIPLGRLALKQGILFLARLKEQGLDDFSISVNFSGAQVADAGFFDYMEGLLRDNHVNPRLLVLEFTESSFFQNTEYMSDFTKKCNDLGIRISLDDFGCGFSSIASLSLYPFNSVKLDKTITDKMLVNEAVSSLISFCHSFGYKVVCEGVETREQAEYLKKIDCEMIQGYYYAKPMMPQETIAFAASMERMRAKANKETK